MSVVLSVDGSVARITIDRPDVRNAIDIATLEALDDAVGQVGERDARAVLLSGTGGAFCAGADLGLVKQAFAGDAPSILGPLVDILHGVIRRMRALPMPIVAAIEGPAVGAGAGLALACDLRVAARSAVLVPGYFGIGSSPDGGVSYFLGRAFGGARALSLFVRNKPIGADQLLAAGLVEEVVDDGTAVEAGARLAAEVSSVPPLALVRTRTLVDTATTNTLSEQLDDERDGVAAMWPTRDFKEGVGAFLERRRPEFTGS